MGDKKHPGGRPTDYSEELVEKGYDYIANFKQEGQVFPSAPGLCKFLGVSKTTIYRWKDEEGKEEFRDMLATLNTTQELELLNGGLNGDYNSQITKLVLAKHGYHDKQEVNTDITSKGEKVNLPMHTFIKTGD